MFYICINKIYYFINIFITCMIFVLTFKIFIFIINVFYIFI